MSSQPQPGKLNYIPEIVLMAQEAGRRIGEFAEAADREALMAPAALDVLKESGLAMAPFPTKFGGQELLSPDRSQQLAKVLRILGGADLSVARIFEGHVNAVALVTRFGTEEQIGRLAVDVADGNLSGVWGADDAQGLHARQEDQGWLLEGRKILASGAGFIQRPIVSAKSNGQQILLLLELKLGERADTSQWTPQGMRSSATGAVQLSGLRVPADRTLGAPGDFMRQPYFSGGAWRFCAVHLGAMEVLVNLFRDQLIYRARGEDAYQLQRVAGCIAAVTTTRFWIETCAAMLGAGDDTPANIAAFADLTRMVTERSALDVLENVHRGVGLSAFISPNPIERISRDLSTYLRQPAPDIGMADAARNFITSTCSAADLWPWASR